MSNSNQSLSTAHLTRKRTGDELFLVCIYLHCRNSRQQSKGIHHHQGPLRRDPLQRYHNGHMLCYFQSPPSRYVAHSCPEWTGHGSASTLQGKRARHRAKQSITKNHTCSLQTILSYFSPLSSSIHFLEIRYKICFVESSSACVSSSQNKIRGYLK